MAKWPGCFFRELIAFNHFNRIGAERLAVTVLVLSLLMNVDRTNYKKNQKQQKTNEGKERKKEAQIFVMVVVIAAAHQSDSSGEPHKVSLNVHELHEKNQWERVHYDTAGLK